VVADPRWHELARAPAGERVEPTDELVPVDRVLDGAPEREAVAKERTVDVDGEVEERRPRLVEQPPRAEREPP